MVEKGESIAATRGGGPAPERLSLKGPREAESSVGDAGKVRHDLNSSALKRLKEVGDR